MLRSSLTSNLDHCTSFETDACTLRLHRGGTAQMFSSTHIGISPRMFPHIALMNFPGLSIKKHFDRRKRYLVWMDGFSSSLCLMQRGFLSLGHRVDERVVVNMLVCTFKGFSLQQIRLLTIHNCWSKKFVLMEAIRRDSFPWTLE
jgi:hypothetical protein